MSEKITTSNGYEIEQPIDIPSSGEFKGIIEAEFGIDGASPQERVMQLKSMAPGDLALLIDTINRVIQGSADSLEYEDGTMKIGDHKTIPVEHRADVFLEMHRLLKEAPDDINPGRIGDFLALGVVLLHPFRDGNGRTARVIGGVFREDYDNPDEWEKVYSAVAAPRDEARSRGGFLLYGYIPHLPDGADRSNPGDVVRYMESLFKSDRNDLYTATYDGGSLYPE
ncbi:MAG: Fic family protein [Candidatus Saccharibacteria bacterium]|nr:Fic family protein [Candidatus Saccharibacteria bacterium]